MHIDKRIPNCVIAKQIKAAAPPHCTEFFLITAESPQWIPSSGPCPEARLKAWPGQTKHSFEQTQFQLFWCSIYFTFQAAPRGKGQCSTALPSWPPGPALCTPRGGSARWNQISIHRGIHRPPFPSTQNRQTSTMLFITVFYSTQQEQHFSPSYSADSQ